MAAPSGPSTSSCEHGGLTFAFAAGSIGAQRELEALAAAAGCGRAPLPEEAYPRNFVAVAHPASGWALRLDAAGALRAWHAAQSADPAFAKPDGSGCDPTSFDWTYSCGQYDGDQTGGAPAAAARSSDASSSSSSSSSQGAEHASNRAAPLALPLDRLRRRDAPILFGCVVPLFADELHDRGRTEAVVKLRVMPDCFLLLCRLYTRVDGVRARLRDVRWYGELPQRQLPLRLLRDVQVRQADMGDLRAALGLPPLQFVTPMMVAAGRAAAAAAAAAAAGAPAPAAPAAGAGGGSLPAWLAPDQSPQAAPDGTLVGSGSSSGAPATGASSEHAAGGLGLDIDADQVYAALEPATSVVESVVVGAATQL